MYNNSNIISNSYICNSSKCSRDVEMFLNTSSNTTSKNNLKKGTYPKNNLSINTIILRDIKNILTIRNFLIYTNSKLIIEKSKL